MDAACDLMNAKGEVRSFREKKLPKGWFAKPTEKVRWLRSVCFIILSGCGKWSSVFIFQQYI